MRGNKFRIIAAAVILALSAAGCHNSAADWSDTLPVAATEESRPTVSYITEETSESTEPVTFTKPETTKRTAATESTPELATTTATKAEETSGTTESTVSTVPGVPNVPISEFTSSSPLDLAQAASSASGSESESRTAVSSAPNSSGGGSTQTSPSRTRVTPSGASDTETVSGLSEISGTIGDDGNGTEKSGKNRPYSYKFLTEKQTYIYDAIIAAAEQCRDTIAFSSAMDVTADDYCDVYQIVYDDEQALFYIDTKMQYAVNSATKKIANATVFYKYTDEKIQQMQREIDAEVNKILAEVTSDMTDYDKVKLFHDTLASMAVYDENGSNCRDIYGVFVDKRAICGGYSKAFSYLCGKAGIETVTVTGDADGQPHMWNKVKIDGKWYNVDVTYAVVAERDGGYVRYDYFCVPDSMLSQSRTVYEQPYEYPKAVFDDCSYYYRNDLIAENWEDARSILLNQIIECSEKMDKVVQVKCADKEVYEDAVYYLFNSSQKQALDILDEALPYAENKYDCSVVNYNQDSTSLVIKLFLEYK